MTSPIDGEVKTDLGTWNLPWNKSLNVQNVDLGNGVRLLRLTVREGRRITMFDVDPDNARALGDLIRDWADR